MGMKILSEPRASLEQCKEWVRKTKTAHPLALAMVPLLWDAAMANKIDPCVLIAQAMKETGWFNFKGVIRPNFCNTCGLKITKGGGDLEPGAHMRFEYWEDGIMAHSDHLALYAGGSNMPKYSPECASHQNEQYKGNGTTKDPRHFTYLLGKCKDVEDLAKNWAPSPTYGTDIVSMVNQIINTKIEEHVCSGDSEVIKDLEKSLAEEKKKVKDLNNYINIINENYDLLSTGLNEVREINEKLNSEIDYYKQLIFNYCDSSSKLQSVFDEISKE